jgi:hypothetical protein
MLKRMVERETSDAFDLNNHVSIEVSTASFRSTRGYTIVAALLDELAFWPTDDAAAPDVEVIAALRPGMSTIPTSMLLCASSPYARRGALWDTYRAHFGRDGDPILVWHASTTAMNPTVRQAVIDKAIELDPSRAAAEYLAQFRTDVETFIAREVVEAAIAPGRYELPPVAGTRYVAFTDPSGGSGDAMTLGIAHLDRASKHIVLDALRWVMPPFSPDTVVKQFAELLKSYGVHKVTGDRYGGEWPRERFRVCGIAYEVADKPKSDIYGALLPLLNSGRAELLDQPRLVSQLCALERRTARSGRDIIDHPPHAHDDIANAVAGALVAADAKRQMVVSQTAVEHASMPTPYSLRRSRRTLTPLEARDRQRFY